MLSWGRKPAPTMISRSPPSGCSIAARGHRRAESARGADRQPRRLVSRQRSAQRHAAIKHQLDVDGRWFKVLRAGVRAFHRSSTWRSPSTSGSRWSTFPATMIPRPTPRWRWRWRVLFAQQARQDRVSVRYLLSAVRRHAARLRAWRQGAAVAHGDGDGGRSARGVGRDGLSLVSVRPHSQGQGSTPSAMCGSRSFSTIADKDNHAVRRRLALGASAAT
jgi:hypothetical protein